MTPEHDAFLRAIIANPGDDLPRLVYADWLDENARVVEVVCKECGGVGWEAGHEGIERCNECLGEVRSVSDGRAERAEFIRVQIRIAEIVRQRNGSKQRGLIPALKNLEEGIRDVEPLQQRERSLFDAGWFPQFRAVLPGTLPVNTSVVHVVVTRGFASKLRGPLSAFWGERECNGCRVSRYCEDDDGYCGRCNSTGRVSGPTPALVEIAAREPVTEIVITDRRPANVRDQSGGSRRYAWFNGRNEDGTPENPSLDRGSVLPPSLLPDGRRRWNHRTEDAARRALSDAILTAARKRVETSKT